MPVRFHAPAWALGLLVVGLTPLAAQQRPDTLTKAQRDSAATADSIRLVRELEKLQAPGNASPAAAPSSAPSGPTNPRLMPDISAVGDFVADASPKGSTLGDRSKRMDVREIELAIQAAVDPYFRGDIFLGINDEEKISIEQAFLTTTSLPGQLELRIGRYLMPVGKINLTHRHDLHTIEYPWMAQRFLSDDGLKGTGLWAIRVFSPFGFYQELNLSVVDRFGERDEELRTAEPLNKSLSGLAYAARLRNYWDLNQSTNLEISGSALTGKKEQAIGAVPGGDPAINAVGARQTLVGGDVTLRWRPLQQGLYRSFILQGEVMRQINEKHPTLPTPDTEYFGPARDVTGAYAFARWQLKQRTFLGSRVDYVQSALPVGGHALEAWSGYLEFFPSEFSKLTAGVERVFQGGLESGLPEEKLTRVQLQATFALGPHKPHPF